jgi:hypothetical protein
MRQLLLLLCLLCLTGCHSTTDALLPDAAEVEAVDFQWFAPPTWSERHFTVHDHFATLLETLKPYQVEPQPHPWEVRGVLNFILKDGRIVSISVFDSMDGKVAFKIGGTYYRGGSLSKLNEVMSKIPRIPTPQK